MTTLDRNLKRDTIDKIVKEYGRGAPKVLPTEKFLSEPYSNRETQVIYTLTKWEDGAPVYERGYREVLIYHEPTLTETEDLIRKARLIIL